MNNEKISVIVPLYKVEKYLDRCIDSLLDQTFRNMEIILVDDGSPDGCSGICDERLRGDDRITVIHKNNGGLSDARNAGIALAAGEFISFIDSDDYVSPDFFETLYSVMLSKQCDIVECGVVKCYEDGSVDSVGEDGYVSVFSTEEALSCLIAESSFHQHVWNKLYKTAVVRDILFPFGKINEDEFWTYQIFGEAKRAAKINKTMYMYFQRSTSIMGYKFDLRRLDALEGKSNRQKYIERRFPSLALQAIIDFYGSCIFLYQSVLKYMSGSDKAEALRIIRRYKKQCALSFREIMTIENSSRLFFYLSRISFYGCCKIRAVLGIGF